MNTVTRSEKLYPRGKKPTVVYDNRISPKIQGLRGLLPTTKPLINSVRDMKLHKAMKHAADLVSTLETFDEAANNSPDNEAYLRELFQNPQFISVLTQEFSKLKDAIASAMGNPTQPGAATAEAPAPQNPAAAPAANAASPATENDPAANLTQEEIDALPNGPDYAEIKSRGADGMPPTAPNSFTPQHLERALEVRNFAPHYHLSKNPTVGMDAARKATSELQFVPAWDSNVWTDAARADYRARAITNGEIARHLAQFGVEPMDNKGKTLAIPVWNMPDGPIRRYFENE